MPLIQKTSKKYQVNPIAPPKNSLEITPSPSQQGLIALQAKLLADMKNLQNIIKGYMNLKGIALLSHGVSTAS